MEDEAATREENVLYLMYELDRALRLRAPNWTPQRTEIAKRLATTVAQRLAEMARDL
jgi:hypothetical protein